MSIVDQKTLQTPTFLQAMLRTLTINLRFHQESMSLNLSHTLTGYLTKRITGALTLEYGWKNEVFRAIRRSWTVKRLRWTITEWLRYLLYLELARHHWGRLNNGRIKNKLSLSGMIEIITRLSVWKVKKYRGLSHRDLKDDLDLSCNRQICAVSET